MVFLHLTQDSKLLVWVTRVVWDGDLEKNPKLSRIILRLTMFKNVSLANRSTLSVATHNRILLLPQFTIRGFVEGFTGDDRGLCAGTVHRDAR